MPAGEGHVGCRCQCGSTRSQEESKLFIIIGVVAVPLLGGGGARFMIRKKAAEAEVAAKPRKVAKPTRSGPNPKRDPKRAAVHAARPSSSTLADRDGDRYARIGVTLGDRRPQSSPRRCPSARRSATS